MYYGYPYSKYPETGFRESEKLLNDVNKAINDEFDAIHYYTHLAELAPNKQFREKILGIRQDEIRHFAGFSRSYVEMTGKFPVLSLKVNLPHSFKQGIFESIKDEKKTVPFYKEIASKITFPQIQNRFLREAADEQRHYQLLSEIKSYL
jgi:rubrerythrin